MPVLGAHKALKRTKTVGFVRCVHYFSQQFFPLNAGVIHKGELIINRLLPFSGVAACGFFFMFTGILGFLTPEYSIVTQTVSEIGSINSIFELEYKLCMYFVCMLLMLFYYSLLKHSNTQKISKAPSYIVLIFSLSEIAMFTYPAPHEFHNMFGSISMIGWLFPLVIAISWRSSPHGSWLVTACYILFVTNLASIYWMLSPINLPENNPLAGIAQRISFLMLYMSFGVVGIAIYQTEKMYNNSSKRD